MKIVIAGGSGYIGRFAAKHFIQRGWEVVTLARKNFGGPERVAVWDGKNPGPWAEELRGADVLLNLAGRSVNCRYSRRNRREILMSRVESTRALGDAIRSLPEGERPKLWLNSSTATIYAHSFSPQTEEGKIGKGFSVEIAKEWEAAFFSFDRLGTRLVALRSAMVFGSGEGGVYGAYCRIARMGLGGRAASGRQFVSWVHVADFLGAIDWLIDQSQVSGPVNIASPNPLPNADFMRELRASLGLRLGLPAPEALLEIGAIFLRTETELLLKSRCVVPGKLGYRFRFSQWKDALAELAISQDGGV